MDEWDTLSTKTETNVKLKGSKMSINTTKTETETDVKPKGSDMSNDTNPCSVAGIEKTTGDIVKVITGLYTKGVRNKFELAKKVVAGYDSIDGLDRKEFIDESKPMSVYDGIVYPAINEKEWEAARAKLRTSFNKSLPFTETSASKFNRIGRTEWLMKFDAKKLPNDYSFLYYLTSKEVNEKPDILNLVKETLSAKSSITTIKKIISDEKDKAAKGV